MPIIAALNQKGGVGKTSTCHHLSGTLALMGRRVLLVDNDPQASLTQGFWGPRAMRELAPSATVAALYAGDEPFPDQLIRPTGVPGVDLVPGSRHATPFNVPVPEAAPWPMQACLRSFLEGVRGRYDAMLIDNPPNLHLCSFAALVAADFLIVPLAPEDYASQGIIEVRESVAMVQAGPNPALELLGFLITMATPRRAVHALYEEQLRAEYGAAVFATRVAEAVDYVEALNRRLPVAQYKPRGASARTMKALAEEIDRRVAAAAAGRERGAA